MPIAHQLLYKKIVVMIINLSFQAFFKDGPIFMDAMNITNLVPKSDTCEYPVVSWFFPSNVLTHSMHVNIRISNLSL